MGEKDEFVDIADIPSSFKGGRVWSDLFVGIPKGKARKVLPSVAHYTTLRAALNQYKNVHPDTNLIMITRTVNGERITYIQNP